MPRLLIQQLFFRNRRPDLFYEKSVLKNLAKFTGKDHCQSLFFIKVDGLRPGALLRKRLWHRCFPVNFAKFVRTAFLIEHVRWLLLVACILLKNEKASFLSSLHFCGIIGVSKVQFFNVSATERVKNKTNIFNLANQVGELVWTVAIMDSVMMLNTRMSIY